MKIQQLKSGQHFITLPTQIAREKQWKKGVNLKVIINDDGDIVLKK